MMAQRKLWATGFVPWSLHRHQSRVAAYVAVGDQAKRLDTLRSRNLTVYVDERDGKGWQVFERIDLRELAALDRTHTASCHGDPHTGDCCDQPEETP